MPPSPPDPGPSAAAAVAGIFVSQGGVPKLPIPAAEITRSGVVGDRQRHRRYHGGPLQALCLWSAEVVAALRGEGHPVLPGACGENLSLSGLGWGSLSAGTTLRVGSARAVLTLPTLPCKQIGQYFAGGAFRRVDHDRHPGWSRWYAEVTEPGFVAVGDPVVVDPRG